MRRLMAIVDSNSSNAICCLPRALGAREKKQDGHIGERQ